MYFQVLVQLWRMPYECCVTGCNSNYNFGEPYFTVFRFPADVSRQQLWIRRIPRENRVINKNTRICMKHFEDWFLIKNIKFTDKHGSKRTEPRTMSVLTDDAFPTLFS